MRKLIERLLVFFIGIPAIFALVFLLPYRHHLALNIIVIIFSAYGSVEFSAMLEKKQIKIKKTEAFILGSLAPLAATLTVSFNLSEFYVVLLILMAGIMWSVLSHIFSRPQNLDTVINRLAGYISVMAYPGFFMFWLVQMGRWENSRELVFLFLLIVFCNDSFAWLFGSLFGKNNRGIIHASPNKSVAGFIGGILGSLAVSAGAAFLFPSIFPSCLECAPLPVFVMTTGFFTGIFATMGDLAESAIKRSCEFKDSGNAILGRGGILDTIDSICVAAPVFFLIFNLFFPG